MIRIDDHLQPADLSGKIARLWAASGSRRSVPLTETKSRDVPRRCSPSRASTPPAAGRNGRRGFVSARRSTSLMPPATSAFLELGRAKTVGRMAPSHHAYRRSRPRLQQRQHLRQPAAPDGEGRIADDAWERELLRTGAEMLRRGAGGALVADWPMAAATSTPSTARTRCLPIRSVPCARWRVATSWATC